MKTPKRWSSIIHPGVRTDYGPEIGYVETRITAYEAVHAGRQIEVFQLQDAREVDTKTGQERTRSWWYIVGTRDGETGAEYEVVPADIADPAIMIEDVDADFLPGENERRFLVRPAKPSSRGVPYVPEELEIPSITQSWFAIANTTIRQMTQCAFQPQPDNGIQLAEAWWVAMDHGIGIWRVGAGTLDRVGGVFWPTANALPGRSAWYTDGPHGRYLDRVKSWYAHDESGGWIQPQSYGSGDHNLADETITITQDKQ